MPPCCSFPNDGHRHLGLGQRARLARRLAGPPGPPAVLWGGCGHGLRVSTRPWTRFGIIAFVGHLGYELAAGVAVPFAPHLGVRAGAAVSITPIAACYVPAGRLPSPRGDRTFAVVNGFFLAAVVAHYASWPRAWHVGVPWLTECEGLEGTVAGPYNVLLQGSGLAAVAGLVENRSQWRWGAATTLLATPVLRWATPREYARLKDQAARCPRWWNRRLVGRSR